MPNPIPEHVNEFIFPYIYIVSTREITNGRETILQVSLLLLVRLGVMFKNTRLILKLLSKATRSAYYINN